MGRRGVIVVPEDIRGKLGIEEGTMLELEVEQDKLIFRISDLWSRLRERGRNLKVDLGRAGREVDEDEDVWLKRLGR